MCSENDNNLNIENVCRLCLESSDESISIFYNLVGEFKYSDVIVLFAPVTLNVNDGLPDKICNICVNNLNLLHNFRNVCIQSDTWLRARVKSRIKNEFLAPPKEVDDTITVSEQYNCQRCDESFGTEECLETHTTRDHENDESENINEENTPQDEGIDSDDMPLVECMKNKKQNYTCSVCNKQFPSRHAITRHANVHNNAKGKKFKCDDCHIYLSTRRTLLRHRKIHLKPDSKKEYLCKQCDKMFKNQKSYASHMRIHKIYYETKESPSNNDQHEAHQSSDEEITGDANQSTLKIAHPKRVFKCKDCYRIFTKQPSLASHVRVHKENITKKEYICDICNQKFIAYIFLTRHWKCHPEKKIYKCNMCEEAFVLREQLADHINKHNGVRPYECNTCEKKFYSYETLRKHRNIHKPNHTKDKIERLCPHCGKVFSNNTVLRQHLNTHSDTKPFACDQCPSRFVSKRYLKKHVKTHAGIKPHICDECGNAFAKKSSLVKHKRIHTGEKPYACASCDKRFNSSENLKRHIRIHTGEKPYKCKFCDRAFAQSSELTGHTRKHLGDNIYQCDKCPAAFRLHGELREHTRMHFLAEKETLITKESDESSQPIQRFLN